VFYFRHTQLGHNVTIHYKIICNFWGGSHVQKLMETRAIYEINSNKECFGFRGAPRGAAAPQKPQNRN
jgi:hypothetical protein